MTTSDARKRRDETGAPIPHENAAEPREAACDGADGASGAGGVGGMSHQQRRRGCLLACPGPPPSRPCPVDDDEAVEEMTDGGPWDDADAVLNVIQGFRRAGFVLVREEER